jgi:hypothetical protein
VSLKSTTLSFWAMLYLGLPIVLFVVTWCSWYVALPVLVATFIATKEFKSDWKQNIDLSWKQGVFFILFAVGLTLISGQGEYSYQTFDHVKHNLIFSDLISKNWPVHYDANTTLNYYLGYYLVPSYLAKLMGFGWATEAIFVWTLLGFLLGLMLLYNCVGGKWLVVFVVLAYTGLDMIPALLDYAAAESSKSVMKHVFDHVGRWFKFTNLRVEITPVLLQFKWVPQHAIPVLMGSVLIIQSRMKLFSLLTLLLFVVFWSVFAAFGLGLLWGIKTLIERDRIFESNPRLVKMTWMLPLAVLWYAFFSAHKSIEGKWVHSMENVFLNLLAALATLAVVLVPILFFVRVSGSAHSRKLLKWVLAFAVAFMAFSALGQFDLLVRGSAPLYLGLLVVVANSWRNAWPEWTKQRKALFLSVMLLCVSPGLMDFLGKPVYRAFVLDVPLEEDFHLKDAQAHDIQDLDLILHKRYGTSKTAVAHRQYLGKKTTFYSFFFKEDIFSKAQ